MIKNQWSFRNFEVSWLRDFVTSRAQVENHTKKLNQKPAWKNVLSLHSKVFRSSQVRIPRISWISRYHGYHEVYLQVYWLSRHFQIYWLSRHSRYVGFPGLYRYDVFSDTSSYTVFPDIFGYILDFQISRHLQFPKGDS